VLRKCAAKKKILLKWQDKNDNVAPYLGSHFHTGKAHVSKSIRRLIAAVNYSSAF